MHGAMAAPGPRAWEHMENHGSGILSMYTVAPGWGVKHKAVVCSLWVYTLCRSRLEVGITDVESGDFPLVAEASGVLLFFPFLVGLPQQTGTLLVLSYAGVGHAGTQVKFLLPFPICFCACVSMGDPASFLYCGSLLELFSSIRSFYFLFL